MGQWLFERLRQSFVIDNRPGANTNIAIETVAKATLDDYMLGTVGTGPRSTQRFTNTSITIWSATGRI
jgi:tripartite-type tricarboxylate transporter receptor subunit TctC